MADTTGFLKFERELPPRRPVDIRILDWKDVYLARENGEDPVFPTAEVRKQAARCMDCGIPFCHHGCPLANLIPEWNDLARRDDWHDAIERLHATNNFPEFTGKLCPAPCEGSCVLNLQESPVTIKQIEWEIIDRAFARAGSSRRPPPQRTGKQVAVVGSGPAGLAAAQQLTRAGHDVTVYERADRIGGLLRYGIPEFKMEKRRPRPAAGPDARRGHPVRDRRRRRRQHGRRPVDRAAARRSSTPSSSPAARRSAATCPRRAASCRASTWRWSTCPTATCRRSASSTTRRSTPTASTS